MARHQVVKVLCTIAVLVHCAQTTAIDDPTRSKSTAPKSASAPGSVRQARAGGDSRRRDYRCLNCPNTDERARFIDYPTHSYHPNRDYYRQAPLAGPNLPYAAREDRNSWYYPSDYTDLDRRYPYFVSGAEASRGPADYAAGRYEDRDRGYGGGSRYDGRYEDRYYVPAPKQSGYLPAHGPLAPVPGSRYEYGSDYRGNGYDNRDAEYQMRAGLDQYYREPDYDRYTYHRTPPASSAGPSASDYGRDYGRDYPRDYIPPRSYPRDYVRDYPAREYGSYAYRGDYVGGGGGYGSAGGGGYDDRAPAAYGGSANRLGYDNRNFRPWDESYRGTSGFDSSGRGYYFASRLPYGSAPPSGHRDTKPYRVSSHYYLPNSPSSSASSSTSGGGSIAPSSTYSSSSASQAPSQSAHPSGTSPTSSDPHKPGGQAASDTSPGTGNGVGGVSSYDQNQSHGLKTTGGYGGGGGRYADRVDRPDKDALSARYGGGSAGASRYLRPLAGSYLFEREGGVELVPVATGTNGASYSTGRTERLTMQPVTGSSSSTPAATATAAVTSGTAATATATAAAVTAAATTFPSKLSPATPPTVGQVTATSAASVAADTPMSGAGDGLALAQLSADVTAAVASDPVSASEVASLVAASTSTSSTSEAVGGAIADERL